MGGPYIQAITEGKVSGALAAEVIDRVPEIKLNEGQKVDFQTQIDFRNVYFKYPTRDEQVLNNLSFSINAGETTAIVGPSGSGKSTCVQLIERFYDTNQGSVTVDGCDIARMNLSHLRSQIGYVGQEPVLFNQTIRENLLYGNPGATDQDIKEALEKANATRIIAKLADGIQTNVGAAGG